MPDEELTTKPGNVDGECLPDGGLQDSLSSRDSGAGAVGGELPNVALGAADGTTVQGYASNAAGASITLPIGASSGSPALASMVAVHLEAIYRLCKGA